jgi:hypothetical protein
MSSVEAATSPWWRDADGVLARVRGDAAVVREIIRGLEPAAPRDHLSPAPASLSQGYRGAVRPAPPLEGPQAKDQINLTDEDSRIMPVAGGGSPWPDRPETFDRIVVAKGHS